MNEGRKFEIQEPKESLHWISYNLKQLTKEVKEICTILNELKSRKTEPVRQAPPSARPINEEFPF